MTLGHSLLLAVVAWWGIFAAVDFGLTLFRGAVSDS